MAELFRQHSLVEMLAARMRETADALEGGRPAEADRVRRALGIHRGFLLEFHIPSDRAVAEELPAVPSARAVRVLRESAAEPRRARAFQTSCSELIDSSLSPGSLAARTLGGLFREEADRIERHHASEAEVIEPGLTEWIPAARRRVVLANIRKLYRAHVKDEMALVAWASQIHPSAD